MSGPKNSGHWLREWLASTDENGNPLPRVDPIGDGDVWVDRRGQRHVVEAIYGPIVCFGLAGGSGGTATVREVFEGEWGWKPEQDEGDDHE